MALSLRPIEIVEKKEYPLLVIAPNWVRVLLRDIADVQNGFAFKSAYFSREEGVPLIRIRDITKSKTEHFYTGPYEKEYLVSRGDILIGMDGDFTVARWRGPEGLLNQRVCRVIPRTSLYNEKFLFLCLQPYLDAINAETSSVTVKHLSSKTINEIPLPLPPLPEQHRIVEKIERLFAELDKAVEELKKAKKKLELYRQSLLKAAFEGRLTEKWRREHANELESADELLARIKAEREKRYKQQLEEWKQAVKEWEAQGKPGKKPKKPRKPKEVPPLTEEELAELPKLPEGWRWGRINDTVFNPNDDIVDGPFGSNLKNADYVDNGEVPVIGISNIDEGFKTKIRYITFEKFETIKRSAVYPGNIIVAKIGSSYGKAGIYPEWMPVGMIPANLLRIIPSSYYKKQLLLYYLKSRDFKKRLDRITKSTAQPAFNVSGFRGLAIPFPPLLEQDQIRKKIENHFSTLDHLSQTISQSLARAEALRQSILKKAFSGKLVPQDPNDEPASELLKRIRAEREKEAPKTKRKRRRRGK